MDNKLTNTPMDQGQAMLHIPFGELISSVAKGIADAQWELDRSSMVVAELMSGARVLRNIDTGEPERDKNNDLIINDSRVYFGHTAQPQGFGASARAKLPNASGGLKFVKYISTGKVQKNKKDKYNTSPTVTVVGDNGTGSKAKVKVKVDGRNGEIKSVEVTSSGSGYTSPPEIEISGIDKDFVPVFETILFDRKGPIETIELDKGKEGKGYTVRPLVNIIGEGTGAIAEAVLRGDGRIAGIEVIEGGTGYDPRTTMVEILPQPKMVPQKLSMIELGFVPNFYQFVDTVINMKIAITITKNKEGQYNLNAATVDANYSSSYDYKMELAASVQTKIVPIPPPAILEERIRSVIANDSLFEKNPGE